MFRKMLPVLRNRYIFSSLLFLIWISFFDRNNFITQYEYRKDLTKLKSEKQYLNNEILKNKTALDELIKSPESLEKFAREKYFMKKDEEDIFVMTLADGTRIR